ncbi:MAG: LCP family protein [Clostridia bacterium]|nr:LCP family protein [Clostridia bacterium]
MNIEKHSTKDNKKKKKGKYIFRRILVLLLLIIIVCAGILTYKIIKNGGGLQGLLFTAVGKENTEEQLKEMDRLYCVLMGRSEMMTDTILLASYDPKNQTASMLSIPRDTYIGTNPNTATASNKINCLYQQGPEKTVEAISKITGIDVKYYVVIDTKALVKLVDTIGGVDFEVPIDMKYDDYSQKLHIDLKAGYQHLNGNQAEQLVRFRHNNDRTTYPDEYGQEDLGRMRTQREFITQVIKQTVSAKNIFKIDDILDIAYESIETNLSLDVMKDYIPYAVKYDMSTLQTGTVPGESVFKNIVWIYLHDKEETKELVETLFPKSSEELALEEEIENTKVTLINGTGKSNKMNTAKKLLKNAGFEIEKTGTATSTELTTITVRSENSEKCINKIKEILEVGQVEYKQEEVIEVTSTPEENTTNKIDGTVAESVKQYNITIILGKDFDI